ncbi:MAG: PLP-dependent transferase [Lachnospiraceae bacterium]|nr:PLP-dependent transferase [Lachnospiraceae bacterium]
MKNFSNYRDYSKKENLKFDSKAVHGALGCEPLTGAVSFPIYQSATFRHVELGVTTDFLYSRLSNPTRQELERTLAILEEGEYGFCFSSGQAANMAMFTWLNSGDHVLLMDDIYGGTFRIVTTIFAKYGIEYDFIDLSDIEAVKAAIKPNTKMIFIETPSNPMMKVADIAKLSEIAHENGAIAVVDNTFLTPYFQKPLTLGADVVVHSATKYLGGHNDIIAGAVVVRDEKLAEHFSVQLKSHGNGLAPMDSWLMLRGIKTLHLRMQRHNENAMKVAQWLRNHPKVTKVYYVGFSDHKDYEVTCRQTTGFGGMISFAVDSMDTVKKLLRDVDMVLFAESLGGTETLITYPTTQTHEDTPKDVKERLGITDTFLRLSVGIEDADDIINDLKQAME